MSAQVTVAELIALLQKLPQDKAAVVYDPVSTEYLDIDGVEIEHSQVVIKVKP